MAEIILSFVVEEALGNVLSLITEEIKLAWGLDDELNRLRVSLAMVRDLLQDAEGKQMDQMAVRHWLKKIKMWAYDAEDLLDELAYEVVRQKVEIQIQEEVKTDHSFKFMKRIPLVHKTTFRFKMAHKVKKACESLDRIKNEAIGFGLSVIPIDRKWSEINSDQETDSIVDHPVVARGVVISKIVNLLECSCNQQALTMFPIVGMGGIGKTTVAKLVTQQAMEKKLFDVKIWVSVSIGFGEKQILGEMLQTLNKNAGGITNKDAALQHLTGELEEKTFLLVEKYFNELLHSSFFLDAKYDEFGGIQGVRMHDLMHELAVSVSGLDTLISEYYSAGNDIAHVQHLNIIPYGGGAGAVPVFLKDKTETLRTLFAASSDVLYDSCKFKSLRILRLRGKNVKALPDSVGMLKHLRYLDVSFCEITELPESITKLYNLQELWMIDCKLLEKVPKRLNNLVNLRRISFVYEKQMPIGVGCLTNLQRLSFFVVGPDRGGSIQELECLNELSGQLRITNLELVRDEDEAKKANLQRKTKLDKLVLVWSAQRDYSEPESLLLLLDEMFDKIDQDIVDVNYKHKEVLEGLQPCEKLEALVIKNYLGKTFPSWLSSMKVIGTGGDFCSLNNLTLLRLEGCWSCGEIPKVGHLPLLKKLEIIGLYNVRYMGDEFYGSDEASTSGERKLFPSLKRLEIGSMKSLVEWKAPPSFNAFPCLE